MLKKISTLIFKLSVCSLIFSSCMKKQDLESSSLGPTEDGKQIESKMLESLGELNFGDINLNEAQSLVVTRTFEDSQQYKLFTQNFVVENITDTDKERIFRFNYEVIDHLSEQNSQSGLRYNLAIEFNKKSSSDLKPFEGQNKSPTFLIFYYLFYLSNVCNAENVTCHNFQMVESQMTLPPSLSDPRICPDQSQGCRVTTQDISFDLIDRKNVQSDGRPSRSYKRFIVAPRLPFFSKVLLYCDRYLTEFNSRKVLAEDCYNVNSFALGD